MCQNHDFRGRLVLRNQFKAWESYIRAAIQPSAKA
jgi:hypothetical protein